MNNPLLTTLEIVASLADHPASAADLQARFGGISLATLKRHLSEARTLGAQVSSFKSGKAWSYRLDNYEDIRARLHRWIDLEQTRNLVL